MKRISGEGFPLFSGTGNGSLGRLRRFLLVTGLTVMVSACKYTTNSNMQHVQLTFRENKINLATNDTVRNHQEHLAMSMHWEIASLLSHIISISCFFCTTVTGKK